MERKVMVVVMILKDNVMMVVVNSNEKLCEWIQALFTFFAVNQM